MSAPHPLAKRAIAAFDLEREIAKANADYFAAMPLPTDEIPKSLLRRNRNDYDEREPSEAMRTIGREICRETRRHDEREMRRAYAAGANDE